MEQISPALRAKRVATKELKKYLTEWFDYRFKVVEITTFFDRMTIAHKDQILIDKLAEIKQMVKSDNTKPHAIEILNQMKFIMQFHHMKTFSNILYMFEEAGIERVQLKIGYEDFHTFNVRKPKGTPEDREP